MKSKEYTKWVHDQSEAKPAAYSKWILGSKSAVKGCFLHCPSVSYCFLLLYLTPWWGDAAVKNHSDLQMNNWQAGFMQTTVMNQFSKLHILNSTDLLCITLKQTHQSTADQTEKDTHIPSQI